MQQAVFTDTNIVNKSGYLTMNLNDMLNDLIPGDVSRCFEWQYQERRSSRGSGVQLSAADPTPLSLLPRTQSVFLLRDTKYVKPPPGPQPYPTV